MSHPKNTPPAAGATSPFRGIDHLVIRVADARPLFDLLASVLALPVTWPLEQASFATFGWIGVGNANLEIWADAKNADLPEGCALPLIHGIALAPERMKSAIGALEAKGVTVRTPRIYRSRNEQGELQTNFTNAVLPDVSSPTCEVYLCAWDRDAVIVPWQAGNSTTRRRASEQEALDAVQGGALGVTGLCEIAVASPEQPALASQWRKLRGTVKQPTRLTPDVDISVVVGPQHAVASITLAVRDLAAARSVLLDKGLLAASHNDEVALAPEATGGLSIRLRQAVSADDAAAAAKPRKKY